MGFPILINGKSSDLHIICREDLIMDLSQFELFEKAAVGRTARNMRVSLNDRGTFSLNQKAFDGLNSPAAVELLYDKTTGVIAVRPCSPELKHSYPVKKQGNNKSYLIRSLAFLGYYNLQIIRTVLFDEPKVESGVLFLNTRTAVQIPERMTKKSVANTTVTETNAPTLIGIPMGNSGG